MGVEFTIAVGLFGWLGYEADARWALFGKLPAFLLLGVFVGVGVGVYRLHYQLARLTASTPKDQADDETEEP